MIQNNLKTPLMQLEFTEYESRTITKSMLHQIHEKQLVHNQSNENNTDDIISALGGIDQILRVYLSSKNKIPLHTTQLKTLYEILYTKPQNKISISFIGQATPNEQTKVVFDRSDTYLHQCMLLQHANKLMDIVYNRFFLLFTICINVIYILYAIILDYNIPTTYLYYGYKLFVVLFNNIYSCLICLSFNRNAFRQSFKSFTFWFKVLTSIQVSVSYAFMIYKFDYGSEGVTDWRHNPLQIIDHILNATAITLIVVIFSAIDSICLIRKYKIVLGIGVSAIFTIWAVNATVVSFSQDLKYDEYNFIFGTIKLSTRTIYASSFRVLSIFLWRQTIWTILAVDEAVNIRVSPTVRWI
eukprot:521614_1